MPRNQQRVVPAEINAAVGEVDELFLGIIDKDVNHKTPDDNIPNHVLPERESTVEGTTEYVIAHRHNEFDKVEEGCANSDEKHQV